MLNPISSALFYEHNLHVNHEYLDNCHCPSDLVGWADPLLLKDSCMSKHRLQLALNSALIYQVNVTELRLAKW